MHVEHYLPRLLDACAINTPIPNGALLHRSSLQELLQSHLGWNKSKKFLFVKSDRIKLIVSLFGMKTDVQKTHLDFSWESLSFCCNFCVSCGLALSTSFLKPWPNRENVEVPLFDSLAVGWDPESRPNAACSYKQIQCRSKASWCNVQSGSDLRWLCFCAWKQRVEHRLVPNTSVIWLMRSEQLKHMQ